MACISLSVTNPADGCCLLLRRRSNNYGGGGGFNVWVSPTDLFFFTVSGLSTP